MKHIVLASTFPGALLNTIEFRLHLEERLTVSQSVPEPASMQAVRQIHTVWVFCQWRMRPQAAGMRGCPLAQFTQWPRGNASDTMFCGRRFEPRSSDFRAAAGAKSEQTRIRTADRKLCVGCVTVGPSGVC